MRIRFRAFVSETAGASTSLCSEFVEIAEVVRTDSEWHRSQLAQAISSAADSGIC